MKLSTFEAFKHIAIAEDMIVIEGETLQSLQRLLLSMLKDIDHVCEVHGIQYTLSGGTLLGAVRHEGFIPWDDDIDINMTRIGYEKFASVFEQELGEGYILQRPEKTENYGLGLARIRKKGTILRNRDDYDSEDCGIAIDIFIYEDVPDSAIVRKLHGFVSLGLGFALSCRRFLEYGDEYMKLAEGDESLTKVFSTKRRLGRLFSFLSMDAWGRAWDKWNSLCRNDESRYISIPAGRKHYFGELYERELMFPVKRIKFEDALLPVPNTPDHYLTKLYGDYMRIPEPEDREAHIVYELDLGDES